MKFSEPRKLADGRYFVKTVSDDDGRVFAQLNNTLLVTPFAEGDSVTLDVNSPVALDGIDTEILAAAQENSTSWFGREVHEKTISNAYRRSLVNNTITVSKFKNVKAFDASKEVIDPLELTADVKCDVVVELVGLTFMKKTFEANWRIVQIRKKRDPPKKFYEQYLFTDDPEEAEEADEEEDDCL